MPTVVTEVALVIEVISRLDRILIFRMLISFSAESPNILSRVWYNVLLGVPP